MVKKEKETRLFKIRPETEKEQMALDMFHFFNGQKVFSKTNIDDINISTEFIGQYIDLCEQKKLLMPHGEVAGDMLTFNAKERKIIGIGFRDERCFLTVMDMGGNITARECIETGQLVKGKVKSKDIEETIRSIGEKTGLKDNNFACCGVAVPEEMIRANPKSIELISSGAENIFGCTVFTTTSATAAGYGDRDFCSETAGKNILYMYSDVGIGVILKKESIFEADEYSEVNYGAYLRPWNQFSIVNTTKDLVARGVGTDIVEMVKGDIDAITTNIVLKAAERKDELAEDLVKRSGLALGVRVAYLVNMFNVEFVLFGGGTEKDEGGFVKSVQESMGKFLSKEVMDNLKIIPGVLGEEASSVGAAALCRREMFMEV
jgi:predicted NBD/HSP70 family sugar kinase